MSWSQCSNTPTKPSRFYEYCESASENFLYRGTTQDQKGRSFNAQRHTETILSGIRRYILCCFGRRHGNRTPMALSEFGLDVSEVFESGRSQASGVREPHPSTFVWDRSKVVWAIEPDAYHKRAVLTPTLVRWIVLSWSSKVVNGETMNRGMLESIMEEASRSKQTIDTISKSVIKEFQGLQLAEDISSFETMDHIMAIDSLMETLNEHAISNRVAISILVKREGPCYSIYFNNRGESRDVILLEANAMAMSDGVRMVAFYRLEDLREYMMDTNALKSLSSIYYHVFNVKSLNHDANGDRRKQVLKAPTLKTTISEKCIDFESYDPRKDAKIVFSHAKLVAKM